MTITITQLALGALFLVIPFYAASVLHAGLGRKLAMSAISMLTKMALLGGMLFALFKLDNMAADIAFALLFVVLMTLVAVKRARLKMRQYYLPVLAGMGTAVVANGLFLLFACLSANTVGVARMMAVVMPMLAGCAAGTVGKSLATFYSGLRNHGQLYYYLLGNGATRSEALRYLARRAVTRAMLPEMGRMAGMAVGVAPVLMWTMLSCGTDLLTAIAFQILVTLASLNTSVVATLVALAVARHYALDEYGRMKSE